MQDVVHAVFAYISMLRAPGGVTQQRFEENKALSELRFRFADKSSPYHLVEKLASAMQTYADRQVQQQLQQYQGFGISHSNP